MFVSRRLAPWCSVFVAAVTLGCLHAGGTSDDDSGSGSSSDTGGPTCGDGNCDPDETSTDCPADCSPPISPTCGDGKLDDGEVCDSKGLDTADCNIDCSAPTCGDAYINTAAGEVCDDGPANSDQYAPTRHCGAACTAFAAHCGDDLCGDGQEDAATCPQDCAPACGNGATERGEACDPGLSDSEDCDADCSAVECGDGYLNSAAEACDDGNDDDTDACTNACVAAACGDGIVQAGVELCDDGNQVDDDACSNTCAPPRRVFLSSAAYKGDLSPKVDDLEGVALGDAHCQQLADAAGLGGTWFAWLGDGRSGPAARFDTTFTGAYQLLDGTVISAAGWADLTDGTLAHAIDLDEQGAVAPGENVWTSAAADGTATGADACVGWTSAKVTEKGVIGVSDATDVTWTSVVDAPCSGTARLYCFEQ